MITQGHNVIAADRLKSFVERIQNRQEERKAISGEIADIYAEAKSTGFDKKALRQLVKLMGMNPAERENAETLLDIYKVAMGIA